MVNRKSAASDAVRQAEISVREIRARAKKLLSRAQMNVREYRKELRTLQKQGIVSKRITPRSHQPTRYMLGKIKKFKGVAVGHELAISARKLSPHKQRLYTERGLAQRIGNFFIIPKTAEKQRADIHKDHIRVTTQLKRGEERVIKFPARMEDLNDFLKWAENNAETLNALKGPRDQFGFQLFGHNARIGFPNIQALLDHLGKYSHILNNRRSSRQAIQELVLVRFRPGKGGPVQPTMEPYYGEKKYSRKKRDRKDERKRDEYRRENARKRKARQRATEDKEAYENRLAKQRQYDRANANDRREKRMSKRLLGD